LIILLTLIGEKVRAGHQGLDCSPIQQAVAIEDADAASDSEIASEIIYHSQFPK
jgi:hypothetical protein